MMHKVLYPRDDKDRQYVTRKEGGGGFTSIEDSIDVLMWGLEDYIKKSKKDLLQQPLAALTTQRQTEQQQKLRNQNKKTNNDMDTLNVKLTKSHMVMERKL